LFGEQVRLQIDDMARRVFAGMAEILRRRRGGRISSCG
jgi:hypothetical protein